MEVIALSEAQYDVVQTANALKVHPETIRRWIHKGQLKAVKVIGSKKFLVAMSEINRLKKGTPA